MADSYEFLKAHYDRIVAAKASKWQPIATMPKDGAWYLGWNRDFGCFVWRDGPGLITGEDPSPTHWMPIPAPPAGTEPASTESFGLDQKMQLVVDELRRRMAAVPVVEGSAAEYPREVQRLPCGCHAIETGPARVSEYGCREHTERLPNGQMPSPDWEEMLSRDRAKRAAWD